MPYITKEAEVWVDLEDFEDEELIEEMKSRGLNAYGPHGSTAQIINTMYEYEKTGKDITEIRRELYYTALGKIA